MFCREEAANLRANPAGKTHVRTDLDRPPTPPPPRRRLFFFSFLAKWVQDSLAFERRKHGLSAEGVMAGKSENSDLKAKRRQKH